MNTCLEKNVMIFFFLNSLYIITARALIVISVVQSEQWETGLYWILCNPKYKTCSLFYVLKIAYWEDHLNYKS